MKREIKFRLIKNNKIVGYERFDHGEWFYSRDGSQWNEHFILHDDKDQYTGLPDKHGTEIAQADIVKNKVGLLYEVRFGKFADTKWHAQYGFYLYDFESKMIMGNMGYEADESCPLERR
jgi:YopX protein